MFEDFGQEQKGQGDKGRKSASALMSVGIFGGVAALIITMATAHHIRVKRQKPDMDVTFDSLPQMQAPKAKVVEAPKKKKGGKKKKPKKMTQLAEIPDEVPEEAEGELIEAEDTGAIDGVDEGGDGTGGAVVEAPPPPPPPAPKPVAPPSEQQIEMVQRPVFVSGCRAPDVPDALLSQASTILVDVRMIIGADGKVLDAKVLRSHDLVPEDVVLNCARAQVFEPAHLPDGTAVPYPFRRRFTFKPAQA